MRNSCAPDAAEKRRFPRFAEEHAFALKTQTDTAASPPKGRTVFFHKTQDISLKGLRFQQNTDMPVGARLRIFFTIPETLQLIRHTAVVRWCRQLAAGGPFATGLEFVTEPEPTEPWLAFVASRPSPVIA
jgi:hypothetical protein